MDILEDYVLDTINENINIAAYDGLDKEDIFEASRNLEGDLNFYSFCLQNLYAKISIFAKITILLIFSYIYFGNSHNMK